jgi:hypothetical protein
MPALNLASFQKNTKLIGVVGLLIVVFIVSIVLGKSVLPKFLAKASTCPVARVRTIHPVEDLTNTSQVINWDTADVTEGGVVQYGLSAANLSFSAVASESGRTHNVSVKFLTPNTTYYYLIKSAGATCDSSGQPCTEGTSCVPWTFSTGGVTPAIQPPTSTPAPASPSAAIVEPTIAASASATPTDKPLSALCQGVKLNIGKTRIVSDWAQYQQYDIDGNGIINGKDNIACIRSGK